MRQNEPLLNVRFDSVGVDTALDQLFKAARKPWRLDGLTRRDLAGTVTIRPQRLRLSEAVKQVLEFAKTPLVLKIVEGEYVIAAANPTPGAKAETPTENRPAVVRPTANAPRPRPSLAANPELMVQTGHTKSIVHLAFSPDGTKLVSGGRDGTRVWDLTTGLQERLLPGERWSFTPDGKWLWPESGDDAFAIDLTTGQRRRLEGVWEPFVAVSPDLQTTAAGGDDAVVLRDIGGRELGRIGDGKDFGYVPNRLPFRFALGGRVLVRIASRNYPTALVGHDPRTGQPLWSVPVAHELRAWAVSPDGTRFVAWSPSGPTLIVVEIARGAVVRHALKGQDAYPIELAVFPDSRHAAVASDSGVAIYRLGDGKRVRPVSDQKVGTIAVSPDGRRLALASGTRIRIVDAEGGREQGGLTSRASGATALAFDVQDGLWFGQGLSIAHWIAGAPKPTVVRVPSPVPIDRSRGFDRNQAGALQQVLALAPSRRRYVARVGVEDAKREIYRLVLGDAATGQILRELCRGAYAIDGAAFSPDGRRIALWSPWGFGNSPGQGVVSVRDSADGRELWRKTRRDVPALPDHLPICQSAAWSGDGSRLVVEWDGAGPHRDGSTLAAVYDAGSGKQVAAVSRPHDTNNPAGHPFLTNDGKRIVGGRWLGRSFAYDIAVWDLASGAVRSLTGEDNLYRNSICAFHPDGRTVALGGWQDRIRFFDLATDRKIGELKGHTDTVNAMAFRGDGEVLASASDDGSVRLWKVPKL